MAILLCPLCSQTHFDTLETLRSRLVRAATQNIQCPICNEVLLGLDKLTIHLFGHSLPPVEVPEDTRPTQSTVNMEDLSFLTSWDNQKRNSPSPAVDKMENTAKNIYIEIKTLPQSFNFQAQNQENSTKEPLKSHYNFRNPIDIPSNPPNAPINQYFQSQSSPDNLEKIISPNFIEKPQKRSFFMNEASCQTEGSRECTPHTPGSPTSFIFDGDTGFLMTPTPIPRVKNENRRASGDELSQYMVGQLRLEQIPNTVKLPVKIEPSYDGLKILENQFLDDSEISEENVDKVVQGLVESAPQTSNKARLWQKPGQLLNESASNLLTKQINNDGSSELLRFCRKKKSDSGFINLQDINLKTGEGVDDQQTKSDVNLDKEERHQCRECGKSFRMRGSLIVHARVAHGGRGLDLSPEPRNFHCNVCSKSFKKEQHLSQHLKTHDGKQWQCETCAKYFTTKYFLKKHQRLHTGEMPYYCEACGKAFTFQQSYHKHLLYHSSDKPHECRECGRAFKELSTLHNHQRIHTGEKPFACETCGTSHGRRQETWYGGDPTPREDKGGKGLRAQRKCFRQRVSYIVHQRIHTGVLPYQCTACYKKFRYKVSQRSHKCTAQPPGIVVRQPGDLIQRLLQQRSLLQCQQNTMLLLLLAVAMLNLANGMNPTDNLLGNLQNNLQSLSNLPSLPSLPSMGNMGGLNSYNSMGMPHLNNMIDVGQPIQQQQVQVQQIQQIQQEERIPCSCGVFLNGQFRRGSNEPPRGNPALLQELTEPFQCNALGERQCTNKCLETIMRHLPNSPLMVCGSIDRDCHKERAYLFVKNCRDKWINTNLSAGREYCCKDGSPYKCPPS